MMRLTALVLVLAASLAYAAPPAKELIGIWQASHEIAAGWNETYRFFPDGKVIWHANQMDLEARLLERRGTWSLDANKLQVIFTEETVLAGGRRAKPEEEFEGESVWIGAKTVDRKLSEKLIQETTFKTPSVRNGYPSATLFGKRFWKMRDDPKDYQ